LARRLLGPLIEKTISAKPAPIALQAALLPQEFSLRLLIRLTALSRTMACR
jgi:hypothetical protein